MERSHAMGGSGFAQLVLDPRFRRLDAVAGVDGPAFAVNGAAGLVLFDLGTVSIDFEGTMSWSFTIDDAKRAVVAALESSLEAPCFVALLCLGRGACMIDARRWWDWSAPAPEQPIGAPVPWKVQWSPVDVARFRLVLQEGYAHVSRDAFPERLFAAVAPT